MFRNFYAVPLSTHKLSGEIMPLSDRFAKEDLGLTGSQWYNLLVDEFDECNDNDEPMVVIFHNFVSGEDDEYMSAFEKFVQYSTSKNAKFVKTSELVEIAKDNQKMLKQLSSGHITISSFSSDPTKGHRQNAHSTIRHNQIRF
ncbi:MAG: hypothetical protein ACXQT4_06805 [Methanotrichaceae archaeon]